MAHRKYTTVRKCVCVPVRAVCVIIQHTIKKVRLVVTHVELLRTGAAVETWWSNLPSNMGWCLQCYGLVASTLLNWKVMSNGFYLLWIDCNGSKTQPWISTEPLFKEIFWRNPFFFSSSHMRMAIPGNIFGQLLSTDRQSRLEVILYIGAFCVPTLVDNVESVKSVLSEILFLLTHYPWYTLWWWWMIIILPVQQKDFLIYYFNI